jgi:hypothetical protein
MLRNQPTTESGLDVAREFIGLIVLVVVCYGVYQFLAGLAAHIRPVLTP